MIIIYNVIVESNRHPRIPNQKNLMVKYVFVYKLLFCTTKIVQNFADLACGYFCPNGNNILKINLRVEYKFYYLRSFYAFLHVIPPIPSPCGNSNPTSPILKTGGTP